MRYRKEDKYKTLGISLAVFIIILLFLALKPKPGLDNILTNQSKTDSVQITDCTNGSSVNIVDSSEKAAIFTELKRAIRFEPKAIAAGYRLYSLKFYNLKNTREIILVNSPYDGKMIMGDQAFFRNDGLWTFVQNKFRTQ
jgi:hypothetical protein